MPGTLRLILGDQLSRDLSALRDIDVKRDTILMAEVAAEAAYVPHHKKKLAFIFAAMRHFAEDLRREGLIVRYHRLDDDNAKPGIVEALTEAVQDLEPNAVVMTECGEWRLDSLLRDWAAECAVPVDIRKDDRFLAGKEDFAEWADGRKQLRMEYFYREMRRRYDILMEPDGKPVCGRWNFDSENRKPLSGDMFGPEPPLQHQPDEITRDVLAMVAERFADHPGDLDPFHYAVTRDDAAACADDFFVHRLARFGDHQDAMLAGQDILYHALLSLYLNVGLLDPLDLCRRAEAAYRDGNAPLNSAEGFIRQILGWREYVRGLYWLKMPDYAQSNFLSAERPLPTMFWDGETDLACLRAALGQTLRTAYAHHIQRLMVIGNFALLCGFDPRQVCEWYLSIYVDAFEWVELPNTHGMALFADGGVLGSKPYAASGKYIDRMSDYCGSCRYNPKKTVEDDACPYNALYWNFLMQHSDILSGNPRMALIYKGLSKLDDKKRAAIREKAHAFLKGVS